MTKITVDRSVVQQVLEALEVATTPLTKDRQEVLRAQATLRAALAQQADKPQRPKCFEFALDFLGTPENGELLAYIEQLEARAALAQQAEPVTEDMKSAVRWAPSSAYWSERLREFFGPDAREGIDALERRIAGAQERAEPDLSLCPQCNGPADNGHDRSIPPSPYLCTKCMAEMPQPSYNVTVVDDAHPNGIPLEQWQNKPVQKPVAWSGYDLDGMVEAFSRVIEAHHSSKHPFHNPIDTDAKMALRILRGFIPSMKAYAATPQRKPLTKEEIMRAFYAAEKTPMSIRHGLSVVESARIVERAHGIKE